jgi:DNA primase large subunit
MLVIMLREAVLAKEDQAKYPFIKEARSFIEIFGIEFKEISQNEYPSIIKRASAWVETNIKGTYFLINRKDPDTDILAYPLALAFIYAIKKDRVVNRFATSEQKRIAMELQQEKDGRILYLAKQSFNWDLETSDLIVGEKKFDFSIDVQGYLENAPHLQSAKWKLINRYLINGRVFLKKDETIRLISEAARKKIVSRLKEEEIKKFSLPDAFTPHLEEVKRIVAQHKEIFEDESPLIWAEEARPPCIIAIMNDLQAGKNLSHMARFAITTFMTSVGKSVDDTISLFSNVADFDAGKARYQIEHIAGKTGSKTKYTMPKCDVLRSFGLCVSPDIYCKPYITHPLRYYREKLKEMNQKTPKQDGSKIV